MTAVNPELKSFQAFNHSKYSCIKHTSYFQVYEELLSPYRGKKITFVEVGVLNGGSLFMWREFFGPEARIIGVELNPAAKKWEQHGFEIHIGSQADASFWENFYRQVGQIDVLLDDGGHYHDQQIITTLGAIPHVRDGGLVIVEDVHTSYMAKFNGPSKYSFINFATHAVEHVNARFPNLLVDAHELSRSLYSISFFESIVAFRIDRSKCFTPAPITNSGEKSQAKDFGKIDQKSRRNIIARSFYRLVTKLAHRSHATKWLSRLVGQPLNDVINRSLRSYFR